MAQSHSKVRIQQGEGGGCRLDRASAEYVVDAEVEIAGQYLNPTLWQHLIGLDLLEQGDTRRVEIAEPEFSHPRRFRL